jgi:hypothetical protein
VALLLGLGLLQLLSPALRHLRSYGIAVYLPAAFAAGLILMIPCFLLIARFRVKAEPGDSLSLKS